MRLFAVAAFFVPASAGAAVIAGFDPVRHSRFLTGFEPNPAFFIEEGLISGVALNRATLITPQHYITARHANTSAPIFRGSDGVVRTYSTAASTTLTTTLSDATTAASDLMVFTLTDPIPTAHGVSPLALVAGDPAALHGRDFVVMGQSNQAGRNVIDDTLLVTFDGGGSPTEAIRYSFDTDTNGGSGGLPIDEAGLIGGDSGYPALLRVGDQLAFIGTHYGIDISDGQVPENFDRYDSYSTRVTPYLDQISEITAAAGFELQFITVTSVPEPAAPMILIAIAFVAWRRMNRRSRGQVCRDGIAPIN